MKRIDDDIKNGSIKKAYLLFGDEGYLVRQYRDKLKKALVNEDDTMNYSAYEGEGIDPLSIIDLAETLPFFADRRVILIEDSGLFKKNGEALADYLPNSPDSTCFIFVEKDVDKKTKLYKAVNKAGLAVDFVSLDESTLAKWIGGKIKREGKGMTKAAYELFIEKAGSDMDNMDKEIEKLLCYCMDKEMIEEADVAMITTEQVVDKMFPMVDAISEHKQKLALDLYYDLVALRVASVKIMFMLTRHYEKLMLVKNYANQGYNDRDIASKIGLKDWMVKKYRRQASSYSYQQLKQAVRDGIGYEEAVKTGKMDDGMAVELFIVQYSTQKRNSPV